MQKFFFIIKIYLCHFINCPLPKHWMIGSLLLLLHRKSAIDFRSGIQLFCKIHINSNIEYFVYSPIVFCFYLQLNSRTYLVLFSNVVPAGHLIHTHTHTELEIIIIVSLNYETSPRAIDKLYTLHSSQCYFIVLLSPYYLKKVLTFCSHQKYVASGEIKQNLYFRSAEKKNRMM